MRLPRKTKKALRKWGDRLARCSPGEARRIQRWSRFQHWGNWVRLPSNRRDVQRWIVALNIPDGPDTVP